MKNPKAPVGRWDKEPSPVPLCINGEDGINGEVRECFKAYGDMMVELIDSDYTPEDLTILLPKIGTFYFCKHKGRKNGSTYKFYGKEVVANNEKSYYKLKFKTCHQLNTRVKEKTKHYEE